MSRRETVKWSADAVLGFWGRKEAEALNPAGRERFHSSPCHWPTSWRDVVSSPASARGCTGKKPTLSCATARREKWWLRIWVNINSLCIFLYCSTKLSNNNIKTSGEYSTLKRAHEAFHRPHKKGANGWALTKWKYHNKLCLGPRRTPSAKGLRTNPNSSDPHTFHLKIKGIAPSTSEMLFLWFGSIQISIAHSNNAAKILWQSKALLKRKGFVMDLQMGHGFIYPW